MSAIFVSYRRQAALVHARAVFERLSREFGPHQVFIDLEGIDDGVDFVELLEQQLRGYRVLLVLIDPGWATVADSKGRRRLELPTMRGSRLPPRCAAASVACRSSSMGRRCPKRSHCPTI